MQSHLWRSKVFIPLEKVLCTLQDLICTRHAGNVLSGASYSKCQLSKELLVKESSVWRLLFLITYQQIRSFFWVGREAVRSVLCRRIGPKENQDTRLDLRSCPSCRERKRVRNRVKQSKPCDLCAFHLHCQL